MGVHEAKEEHHDGTGVDLGRCGGRRPGGGGGGGFTVGPPALRNWSSVVAGAVLAVQVRWVVQLLRSCHAA
jgi:hypothetical protein